MNFEGKTPGQLNIRPLNPDRDLGAVIALWNACVAAGEVVYTPMTPVLFSRRFLEPAGFDPHHFLVAEEEGQLLGFAQGTRKTVFLPGENDENTPAYLTCLFVSAGHRRRGIGTALLEALCQRFRSLNKTRLVCAESNPVQLSWTIPGTPGHDHNKAPGVDEGGMGVAFLLNKGFEVRHHEVAMYLDLKDYQPLKDLKERQERLLSQGIVTGRYDPALGYEFDGMCDRVGSEYWRKILRDEVARKEPRVILAATHQGSIVGFTGPVDRQESGRGWFSGICTDPDFERRGIATVLFDLLLKEFIKIGADFSTLFTGDSNHAQRIYKNAGFRIARRFAVMERQL